MLKLKKTDKKAKKTQPYRMPGILQSGKCIGIFSDLLAPPLPLRIPSSRSLPLPFPLTTDHKKTTAACTAVVDPQHRSVTKSKDLRHARRRNAIDHLGIRQHRRLILKTMELVHRRNHQ